MIRRARDGAVRSSRWVGSTVSAPGISCGSPSATACISTTRSSFGLTSTTAVAVYRGVIRSALATAEAVTRTMVVRMIPFRRRSALMTVLTSMPSSPAAKAGVFSPICHPPHQGATISRFAPTCTVWLRLLGAVAMARTYVSSCRHAFGVLLLPCAMCALPIGAPFVPKCPRALPRTRAVTQGCARRAYAALSSQRALRRRVPDIARSWRCRVSKSPRLLRLCRASISRSRPRSCRFGRRAPGGRA